jgi:hypothetical protein
LGLGEVTVKKVKRLRAPWEPCQSQISQHHANKEDLYSRRHCASNFTGCGAPVLLLGASASRDPILQKDSNCGGSQSIVNYGSQKRQRSYTLKEEQEEHYRYYS